MSSFEMYLRAAALSCFGPILFFGWRIIKAIPIRSPAEADAMVGNAFGIGTFAIVAILIGMVAIIVNGPR